MYLSYLSFSIMAKKYRHKKLKENNFRIFTHHSQVMFLCPEALEEEEEQEALHGNTND